MNSKSNWKKTRKRVVLNELLWLTVGVALIMSPLLSELTVKSVSLNINFLDINIHCNICINVSYINCFFDINRVWNGIPSSSACDILIQIQATIVTLALTIIALFASILDKSVYGISWPDYFLNKKPKFLKYRCIIAFSLLLLVLNIVLHLREKDKFVVPIFLSSIGLILYAISSVYAIFSGKGNINHEIEDYFLAQFNGKEYLENQSMLLTNFGEDWNKITSIYASEYGKYMELYLEALKGMG